MGGQIRQIRYGVAAEMDGVWRMLTVRRRLDDAKEDFDEISSTNPEWHLKLLDDREVLLERLAPSKHTGETE